MKVVNGGVIPVRLVIFMQWDETGLIFDFVHIDLTGQFGES